ncbi:hypothetical protein V501_02588, partial [Pseudogymnoascus sp. VKM F-4519 (FW-2642)]
RLDLYSVPSIPTEEVKLEGSSQPALQTTTLKVERRKGERETKTPYTHEKIKPQKQDRMDLYSVPSIPTEEVKLEGSSQPALQTTTLKVERRKGKREPKTREKIKPQEQDRMDLYSVPLHVPTQGVKVEDDNQSALHNAPAYESTLEIKQNDGKSLSVIAQKRQEIKPEEEDRLDLYNTPLFETTQEVKLEDDTQLPLYDVPEFRERPSQEDDESDGLLDLLNKESENATNARILAQNTVTIHLNKTIERPSYMTKLAKNLPCHRLDSIEVPIGDPQKVVRNRMILLHEKEDLSPHDGMGRRVNNEDCYKVAMDADDHTLYMIEDEL